MPPLALDSVQGDLVGRPPANLLRCREGLAGAEVRVLGVLLLQEGEPPLAVFVQQLPGWWSRLRETVCAVCVFFLIHFRGIQKNKRIPIRFELLFLRHLKCSC